MLVLSYVYEIAAPAGWSKGLRYALGNWTVSGISTFQSGVPLNITLPGDNAGIGGGPYRPDAIRDPNLSSDERVRERYFDPGAFAQPARGRFGSAARNIVRQGGLNNWDLALFKNFRMPWEGGNIQFRGEAFNAFNHTQWSGYRNGFGAAGFGEANAARDARTIQFGLKFLW
jgi:hypothetical protein